MRALPCLALVATALAATACTSTYHPDYHPVTVTSYEQHVTSTGPAAGAAPGATLNAPPPPVPQPPPPWSAWPSE
jgi:hypothetical protein